MAAQLSSGDLHQFHRLAVAIVAHPCGFETTLASDMHLEDQTLHSVCLTNHSQSNREILIIYCTQDFDIKLYLSVMS